MNDEMLPLKMIAVVCLILLCIWLRRPVKRSIRRHKRYVKTSDRNLRKFDQDFSHPGWQGSVISYLRKIKPYVFEELILSALAKNGYKVIRNKKYSGDGGIDGRIVDEQGRMILIQAKRYSGYVSTRHIENFQILIEREKAYRGLFVHTGKTSAKYISSCH